MRCSSCDSPILDEAAAFCPRCGRPLPATADVTERLQGSDQDGPERTRPLDADLVAGAPAIDKVEPEGTKGPTRRWSAWLGWPDALGAACLAFLALLCVGSLFVVALKLQYPDFGAGAGPISILSTIVLFALASLGAVVHIDGLELYALPLGTLVAAATVITWAASLAVAHRETISRWDRAREGAKLGFPFAVICCLAALAFRFRGPGHDVSVDAVSAFARGLLWGSLFGALGGLRTRERIRTLVAAATRALRAQTEPWASGVPAGLTMFLGTLVLSLGAGLVWIIVILASGDLPRGFGIGDALAALDYLAAFAPNVMCAIAAIALGGAVELGARVTIGGELVGPLRTYSLFDWPAAGTPWFAYALLLIPLASCLFGGFIARSRARSTEAPSILAVAAATYATLMLLLAWLSEARLGAGLVDARGFGRVAPVPWLAGLLAVAWGLLAGYGGWLAGGSQERAATGHKGKPMGSEDDSAR